MERGFDCRDSQLHFPNIFVLITANEIKNRAVFFVLGKSFFLLVCFYHHHTIMCVCVCVWEIFDSQVEIKCKSLFLFFYF